MTTETEDRSLSITRELREALVRVRVARGVLTPPVVRASLIEGVQARVGEVIPDTVLAYYAALDRDLWDIATLTTKARSGLGLPDGQLAFEAEPGGRCWCVATASDQDRVMLQDGMPGGEKPISMARFVTWHADRGKARATEPPRWEVASFDPQVIADGSAPDLTLVEHPVFGRGVVLRRYDDRVPKVEVEFDGIGRKLIAAAFVQDVAPGRPPEAATTRRRRSGSAS